MKSLFDTSIAMLSALLLIGPVVSRPTCSTPTASRKGQDIVQTAAGSGNFKTLVVALAATGLDEALKGDGPFTVFAPTDAAFAKLPDGTLEKLLKEEGRATLASILKYHVVKGRRPAADLLKGGNPLNTLNGAAVKLNHTNGHLLINNSRVIRADIPARNGIIHVIDEVLLPPAAPANQPVSAPRAALVKSGNFKTLLKALEATGLDRAVLDGNDTLTVFAPTDEAFAKIPAATLNKLLQPQNRNLLTTILKYHVVKGKITARAAVTTGEAKTLQGDKVVASIDDDGRLSINRSRVVKPDVAAGNVLVHVIDTVLMPH